MGGGQGEEPENTALYLKGNTNFSEHHVCYLFRHSLEPSEVKSTLIRKWLPRDGPTCTAQPIQQRKGVFSPKEVPRE